jgi:hypothetical protein
VPKEEVEKYFGYAMGGLVDEPHQVEAPIKMKDI